MNINTAAMSGRKEVLMKYLTNTFSPMMLGGNTVAGVRPLELSEASVMASDAVSAISHEVTASVVSALTGYPVKFNRVSLSLEGGDELIVIAPNFRAEVAREFSREEVESAGFRAFHVTTRSIPAAGKAVNWEWNDGIGHRGREPLCLIVDPAGEPLWFEGKDVPGVVRVLGTSYEKNGKWSNTTYRCVSPPGTVPIAWKQDWETGKAFPQDSWEEVSEWAEGTAPHIRHKSLCREIRNKFPAVAERLDGNKKITEEFSS